MENFTGKPKLDYKKQNFTEKLSDARDGLRESTVSLKLIKTSLDKYKTKKLNIQSKIDDLVGELKPVDNTISDIDSLIKSKSNIETKLNKKSLSLSTQKNTADIEKRLTSNITQATSQADTFWEGVAGGGDYQIG